MRPAFLLVIALTLASIPPASAETLTAEGAVQIALRHSTSLVQAEASVLGARSGLWGAYAGVLPRVDASVSRSGSATDPPYDYAHGNSGGLSASWSVLSLSNWANLAGARANMSAARLDRAAARADVILATKRQFYEVVKAMHLARVSAQALRLSRDDERRVRALFEVGSVSKSDLLKAQVRTSQSELDSLLADHAVKSALRSALLDSGLPRGPLADTITLRLPEHFSVEQMHQARAKHTARIADALQRALAAIDRKEGAA